MTAARYLSWGLHIFNAVEQMSDEVSPLANSVKIRLTADYLS